MGAIRYAAASRPTDSSSGMTSSSQSQLFESDPSCVRFISKCMPEALRKLMRSSTAINEWPPTTRDGVQDMLLLTIELMATRLEYSPIHEELMRLLAMLFDPSAEFHALSPAKRLPDLHELFEDFSRRKYLPSSDAAGASALAADPLLFAQKPALYDAGSNHYGYLLQLLNFFGYCGGFVTLKRILDELCTASPETAAGIPMDASAPSTSSATSTEPSTFRTWSVPLLDLSLVLKVAANCAEFVATHLLLELVVPAARLAYEQLIQVFSVLRSAAAEHARQRHSSAETPHRTALNAIFRSATLLCELLGSVKLVVLKLRALELHRVITFAPVCERNANAAIDFRPTVM